MLTPEEFRRQLDEALVDRNRADQMVVETERLRRQRLEGEVGQEKTASQKTAGDGGESRRNQAIFELDAQLPIKQYLEVLRDKIAPREKVNRFGPMNGGEIGYSFILKKWGKRTIVIGDHQEKRVESLPYSGFGTGGEYVSWERVADVGKREVVSALGVVLGDSIPSIFRVGFDGLSGKNLITVYKADCADGLEYEKSINPISWSLASEEYIPAPERGRNQVREAKKQTYLLAQYDASTQEGIQEFAQTLAHIYVAMAK